MRVLHAVSHACNLLLCILQHLLDNFHVCIFPAVCGSYCSGKRDVARSEHTLLHMQCENLQDHVSPTARTLAITSKKASPFFAQFEIYSYPKFINGVLKLQVDKAAITAPDDFELLYYPQTLAWDPVVGGAYPSISNIPTLSSLFL